jgi:hypothetical protein
MVCWSCGIVGADHSRTGASTGARGGVGAEAASANEGPNSHLLRRAGTTTVGGSGHGIDGRRCGSAQEAGGVDWSVTDLPNVGAARHHNWPVRRGKEGMQVATERWLGVVVASDKLILVDATVDGDKPIVIQSDATWSLQAGSRPDAYRVMHQRIADYAKENGIKRAIIKGSAVSLGGTKKAHLEAAELRGVAACALAGVATVEFETKANISRNFGERKVDEYIKDNKFWAEEVSSGDLRVGSREAAMVILAARP